MKCVGEVFLKSGSRRICAQWGASSGAAGLLGHQMDEV